MAHNINIDFMFDESFTFHKTMDESTSFSDDTSWSCYLPSNERWPPLGAAMDDNVESQTEGRDETEDIESLQKEQEQLNSSLFALTSHFAQVQFRLKQIVSAPKQDQEKLLKELEDFAFQACPEVRGPDDKKVACTSCATHVAYEIYEKRVEAEEDKQRMLSEHLRMLLDELEKYASIKEQTTSTDVNLFSNKSQTSKTKKHGFLVEQLRTKLNVGPDELDAMSPEDLKNQIDKAVAKLVNPGRAKEQLLNQLTIQIKDMESFVEFLKGNQQLKLGIDSEDGKKTKQKDCKKPNKKSKGVLSSPSSMGASARTSSSTGHTQTTESGIPSPHIRITQLSEEKRKRLQDASVAVMRKALSILQIFAISQFGCSARHFEEHMMRKAAATASSMGYQTPLTNLRVAIDQIISLHNRLCELGALHPDTDDDSIHGSPVIGKRWGKTRQNSHSSQISRSRSSSISSCSINSDISALTEKTTEDALQEELIHLVRGDLAASLRELLQHGLCKTVQRSVLTTKGLIGCMASNKRPFSGKVHVWELFQEFYKLKHGRNFNNQPNVKLSEAFGVDLGGTRETPKQSLLTELYKIKSTHEPRKRSYDSMYKALICSALNQQRLLLWIRLVARSPELMERHYERWSYMARTGFDEVLNQIERLTELKFYLPEDLAIRHLMKSYNEFGDPY